MVVLLIAIANILTHGWEDNSMVCELERMVSLSTATYDKRKIKKILKNNGYVLHHQNGSHLIYRNDKGRHLTITVDDCNKMVFQRLVKEHGLKVD